MFERSAEFAGKAAVRYEYETYHPVRRACFGTSAVCLWGGKVLKSRRPLRGAHIIVAPHTNGKYRSRTVVNFPVHILATN
ncbi:hypothetical protein [Ancylobacter mangrovi]|uniref:Uncharacterized protein n=1 Tax=Ancylobacter mangrovi TaxID=2972472 RepID=A0A9X2T203_9HYPH|nr:hypothetical protein [Ancylobacter mangrovi]MCS0495337.1 hypothetical protein [Ancylobacter mangrovi]MCS0502983.1 hypothetical protein [Ancylobacter mangrovi]